MYQSIESYLNHFMRNVDVFVCLLVESPNWHKAEAHYNVGSVLDFYGCTKSGRASVCPEKEDTTQRRNLII